MSFRTLAIAFALLFSLNANATDDIIEICSAGGYYAGAEDHFLSGLARHILQKHGVLGSLQCNALWKNAVDVGERFSRTGKKQATDKDVLDQATGFSTRIYNAISKSSGYSE